MTRRPFAHVHRNHHDDGRERGKRDVGGERRGHEDDAEQDEGMDDSGDRRPAAGLDVGRGARDGTGVQAIPQASRREILFFPMPESVREGLKK